MNVLGNSICIDPLTKLQNMFGFLNEDVRALYKDTGTIVISDFVRFRRINEKYGREMGDKCLVTFANVISNTIEFNKDIRVFRKGGDEFTIIFPNISKPDATQVIDLIENTYKNLMRAHIPDIDVRWIKYEYEDGMTLAKYYKLAFDSIYGVDEEISRENWMEQITHVLTRNIKETIKLYNNANKLALTDDISQLLNHRAATSYLEELLNESKVTEKDFSILFIDGDNLKRYNSISYKAGNIMIRDLSSIIVNSLRKDDKVFRWLSGDEFICILEDVNYDDAIKLAERVRCSVQKETINWTYPITVSIGVSNYPMNGCEAEELINKAEKANSFAKKTGKNKVVEWNVINIS